MSKNKTYLQNFVKRYSKDGKKLLEYCLLSTEILVKKFKSEIYE